MSQAKKTQRTGLLTTKLGMTRLFSAGGEHVPVTVLRLGGCQVVGHRTKEKNGYVGLQLGAGTRKAQRTSKADDVISRPAGGR